MSEPIKVGDLVYVAWVDHSCAEVMLGWAFPFDPHPPSHPGVQCPRCKERDIAIAGELTQRWKGGGIPARWLKRIPPLSELEGEKRKEELTA